MTEETFTKLRTSAAFDIVGSVGGPQWCNDRGADGAVAPSGIVKRAAH